MTVLWPFPGQDDGPRPAYDLPPPRFAVGDRVTTRWGRASITKVCDQPDVAGDRLYQVRHDWSTAPPGFGHFFGEGDIEPLVDEPAPADEHDEPPPAGAQLDLFP